MKKLYLFNLLKFVLLPTIIGLLVVGICFGIVWALANIQILGIIVLFGLIAFILWLLGSLFLVAFGQDTLLTRN